MQVFLSLKKTGLFPSLYVYQEDIGGYERGFPGKTLGEARSEVQREILNMPPETRIVALPCSLDLYTPGGF